MISSLRLPSVCFRSLISQLRILLFWLLVEFVNSMRTYSFNAGFQLRSGIVHLLHQVKIQH